MALTDEEKERALQLYSKQKQLSTNSKKNANSTPTPTTLNTTRSGTKLENQKSYVTAKEKARNPVGIPANKPTPKVESAEVLSSDYVAPTRGSTVARAYNADKPDVETSSRTDYMFSPLDRASKTRSDTMAKAMGVKDETLDKIATEAAPKYGKDWFSEAAESGFANMATNFVRTPELIYEFTPTAQISKLLYGDSNNPITKLGVSEPLKEWQDEKRADAYAAVEDKGKGMQMASQGVTMMVEQIPGLLTSFGKVGKVADVVSDAAKGAKGIKGFLKALPSPKQVIPAFVKDATTTVSNPQTWVSFSQILPGEYDAALANGANEKEALVTSLLSAFAQSKIEVGSGFETLPNANAQTVRRAVQDFVKSAVDEGKEEILQGIVSGITQKLIFDHDKKWLATEAGEDAVLNTADAWYEGLMGTIFGGIMSVPGAMINAGNAVMYQNARSTPTPVTNSEVIPLNTQTALQDINSYSAPSVYKTADDYLSGNPIPQNQPNFNLPQSGATTGAPLNPNYILPNLDENGGTNIYSNADRYLSNEQMPDYSPNGISNINTLNRFNQPNQNVLDFLENPTAPTGGTFGSVGGANRILSQNSVPSAPTLDLSRMNRPEFTGVDMKALDSLKNIPVQEGGTVQNISDVDKTVLDNLSRGQQGTNAELKINKTSNAQTSVQEKPVAKPTPVEHETKTEQLVPRETGAQNTKTNAQTEQLVAPNSVLNKKPARQMSIEAEIQSADALGNNITSQEGTFEGSSKKKKEKSVQSIMAEKPTDRELARYQLRMEAIDNYLANGYSALSAEQKTAFDKLGDYGVIYNTESLTKKRNEYMKKLQDAGVLSQTPKNDTITTKTDNGGINDGRMGEEGENSRGNQGVRGTDENSQGAGQSPSTNDVGKKYPDERNQVLYRVLSKKEFTDAVERSESTVLELYDVSDDYDTFSKALAEGKASNPKGYMVDGKTVEELKESGAKTFLTADGSAGALVTKDGDIEGVFKNSKTSKAKGAVNSLLLTAVANGGVKLDCYGEDLVNFYNANGFEATGRVKYVYGYNPEMDKAIKQEIAEGKRSEPPDVYAMKLRKGVDAKTVAEKLGVSEDDGGFRIQKSEELDKLPLYDGENGYDDMLWTRDRLLEMQNKPVQNTNNNKKEPPKPKKQDEKVEQLVPPKPEPAKEESKVEQLVPPKSPVKKNPKVTDKPKSQQKSVKKTETVKKTSKKETETTPEIAVGARKGGENLLAHKASQSVTYDVPSDSYTDFDNYLFRNDVPSEDIVKIEEKTQYGGKKIPYSQAVVQMVIDEVKFTERDGKYYAGEKEIPKAVYSYGKYVEENGVQYWLNKAEQFPKQWDTERFVSRFVRNVAASKFGDDKTMELVDSALKKGGFIYTRQHNKDSIEKARKYIIDHGIKDSLVEWKSFANGNMKLNPKELSDKIAFGEILADVVYETGDRQTAVEILSDTSGWLTGFGQGIQMASHMRRLGKYGEPFVLSKSEAEYRADRILEGLNKRYESKLHGKKIELSENLRKEWLDSFGTENELEVTEKIFANIANQIPSSMFDRFNAWRMFCMLCAPSTHAKNVTSNIAMSGAAFLKDVYLTRLEANYKKKHPDYIRTASVFTSKKDREFGKKTYEEANLQYGYAGNRYSYENIGIERYRTNTFSGADYKVFKKLRRNIGKLTDFNINNVSHALEAEDTVTKRKIYSRKLAEIMKANNWTQEYFESSGFENNAMFEFAKQKATKEAYKVTFNNPNSFQKKLTEWYQIPSRTIQEKAKKAALGAFIEITFPFKKVSANIPARAWDYSIFGLAQGIAEMKFDSKNPDFDAHASLERIASGMAGSTISAAGFVLGMLGIAHLGGEDENEDELKKNAGWQNYSLEINGHYIALDDIAPATTMLMSGVKVAQELSDIIDAVKDGAEMEDIVYMGVGSFVDMLTFGIDGILQLDFFTSIVDFMTSYGSDRDNTKVIGEKLENILESLVGQVEPNILRKIMRSIEDEYANAYYYDKNETIPKWLQNIRSGAMLLVPDDKIEQLVYNSTGKKVNVPGYTDLAVRYDSWGRSINPEDQWIKIANNMGSPFQISKDKTTPVDEELQRLYSTTKDSSVVPPAPAKEYTANGKTYNMTAKEFSEYSKTLGETRYNTLENLFKSKYYKNLSEEEKVTAIKNAYALSADLAKDDVFGEPFNSYEGKKVSRTSSYDTATESGLSTSTYLSAQAVRSNLPETKDYTKNERFYDYLIADKTTSAKDDVLLLEAFNSANFDLYRTATDNYDEMMMTYSAQKEGASTAEDIELLTEKLDGNKTRAYALMRTSTGTKKYVDGEFKNFGANQVKKAQKLLDSGKLSGEKIAIGARAVTSLDDYFAKTKKNYIAVLMEVGFTEKEANIFYNGYGW